MMNENKILKKAVKYLYLKLQENNQNSNELKD